MLKVSYIYGTQSDCQCFPVPRVRFHTSSGATLCPPRYHASRYCHRCLPDNPCLACRIHKPTASLGRDPQGATLDGVLQLPSDPMLKPRCIRWYGSRPSIIGPHVAGSASSFRGFAVCRRTSTGKTVTLGLARTGTRLCRTLPAGDASCLGVFLELSSNVYRINSAPPTTLLIRNSLGIGIRRR